MQDVISSLIDQVVSEGKKLGLEQKAVAARAEISQETLSRAKKASDIQLSTLIRLANAVGLRLTLVPHRPLLEKILSGDVFGGD